MAGDHISVTLDPVKEPQLSEVFGDPAGMRLIKVRHDGVESTFVVFPYLDQEALAEKIAETLLKHGSFEETLKRLEAMRLDAGETVPFMEFDIE